MQKKKLKEKFNLKFEQKKLWLKIIILDDIAYREHTDIACN